jgi:hypothetical protein
MVDRTTHDGRAAWRELLGREPRQLELPLDGVRSARSTAVRRSIRELVTGFAPRLGANLLMRIGVPMVAATTPVAIGMLAPHRRDDLWANLAVGSGLGGAWGAMVGAALPFTGEGLRISRLRASASGAAMGMAMAPAVTVVSKYVADWITSPLRVDDDEAPTPDGE